MYVRRSGKKWAAYGYDPALKGNRYVGTFETEREAKRCTRGKEEKWADRRNGPITVAKYARVWLQLHPRPKESTALILAERTRAFIQEFGDRELDDDISRAEARAWALGTELPDGKRFDKAHDWCVSACRSFFYDAIDDGYCSSNPFSRMGIPGNRRVITVITGDELARLIELAQHVHGPAYGLIFGCLIEFAAYSAMRPGEAFALKPEWVNFETKRIYVEEAWSSKSKKFTAPKYGKRVIVLFPPAAAALRRLGEVGERFFANKSGAHLRNGSLHDYWDPVRAAFGRPKMDFYELRHFCGTLMADKGFTRFEIAAQMGHNDNGETAERHYIQQDRNRLLRQIETRWR